MPAEAKLYYYYEYDPKQDIYTIWRVIKHENGEFKYIYGYVNKEERAKELVDALNK